MPLVVVGSVALDRVETPSETRDDLLGGSGSYFAYAASYFTPVKRYIVTDPAYIGLSIKYKSKSS